MMLNINISERGNLEITADSDGIELVGENRGYWETWHELLESYSCNGSYTIFDAGDGNPFVGLTSAPCIAESMSIEDDGTRTIDGRFWYLEDYMTRDDLATLGEGETLTFTKGSE